MKKILLFLSILLLQGASFAADILMRSFSTPKSEIWAVGFSPEENLFAAAGRDATVRLWDYRSGKVKYSLPATGAVTSLVFDPKGKYLAAGGQSSRISVWSTGDYALLRTVEAANKKLFALAYSPDGQYLAAGTDDSVKVWNRGLELVRSFKFNSEAYGVTFSDQYMAACFADGTVVVWELGTFRQFKTFQAHDKYVYALAIDSDDNVLFTAGSDGELRQWQLPDMTAMPKLTTAGKAVFSLAFSPDGKFLLGGGDKALVRLWLPKTNELSQSYSLDKKNVFSVVFSPDGKYVAAGGDDAKACLWYTPWEFDRVVQEEKYAQAFAAGMSYYSTGYLPIISKRKAYQSFQAALAAKNTPEAEDWSRKAHAAYIKSLINTTLAVLLILLLGGGYAAFKAKTWLRKRYEAIASKRIDSLLAVGHRDDALAFFRKLRKVGVDVSGLPAEQICSLFENTEDIIKENLPAAFLQVLVKDFAAKGRHEEALAVFLQFKAETKTPYIPEPFSEKEVIDLYVNAGASAKLHEDVSLPRTVISAYALELAQAGKLPEAFNLIGDLPTLFREETFGPDSAADLVGFYLRADAIEDLLRALEAQTFSRQVYLAMSAAFIKAGKPAFAERVFRFIMQDSENPFSAKDYEQFMTMFGPDNKGAETAGKLLPPEMQWRVAEGLLDKGDTQDALNLLNRRPRTVWGAEDFRVCMKIYSALDLFDVAEEMVEQIRLEKAPAELPGFFYEFARCCENKGFFDRAYAIYRELIKAHVDYADIAERYRVVRGKLGIDEQPTTSRSRAQSAPVAEQPSEEPVRKAELAPQPEPQPVAAEPAPASDTPRSISARSKPMAKAARLDLDAEMINLLKDGKLELVGELGKGGMGIVYKVFDKSLNRNVAVKRMKEEMSLSKKDAEKFSNEARMVARLNHPNIVIVYEIIEKHDTMFILFEYIDGKSLERILDDSPEGLSVRDTVRILEQVCNGLAYAHKHNVIHRDLKPSNIMLAKDGLVKITDFGIARMAKDTIIRLTGASTGTLAYMAPEQELGTFDARSDVFSLGVVMYEMLTGDHPFRGPNFYLQKEKMVYKPLSDILPDIPKGLEVIINKCLAADPNMRFSSVDELLKELVGVSVS